MSLNDLFIRLGIEKPVDVIRNNDKILRVITNYDIELYRLGIIPDPYNT